MRLKKTPASLTVLAFLLLIFWFFPKALGAAEEFEEKFEKTVPLAKDGKVILSNISGDIEVKTWDKAEVKIDALKVSKASSLSQAKEKAEKVTIKVNVEGDTLTIETKYPKEGIFSKSSNVSVYYSLTIPAAASANTTSVSGDLSLFKIGGAAKATSVSGDVTLEEIKGALKAKSVSGDVEVMKAAKGVDANSVSGSLKLQDITGDAYLHTVSGNITITRATGSIEAETVSGDVELNEVADAKNINAKALSGFVEYFGDILPEGRYYLKSHSGRIEMTIPSTSAFEIEAKTFSGRIESDFEITISGKISKNEIRGSVNGGGAEVDLKTFSGNIYLKKK